MTPRNRSIPDFQTVLYGRLVLKDDSFHKREPGRRETGSKFDLCCRGAASQFTKESALQPELSN
jgi:hypothetical protein